MEIAAAGIGLRGRRRERDVAEIDKTMTSGATETSPVKRRKLQEMVDGDSRIIASSSLLLTARGGAVARGLNEPRDTSVVERPLATDQCRSSRSEHNLGGASISGCSSNGLSERSVKRRIEFLDLEQDNAAETGTLSNKSCNTRSETSFCCENQEESESMDSAATESCRQSTVTKGHVTVTDAELEDFFTAAEKNLHHKIDEYSRKYNFDFMKEEALEGRYKWVRIEP